VHEQDWLEKLFNADQSRAKQKVAYLAWVGAETANYVQSKDAEGVVRNSGRPPVLPVI
jgi:hypothetical protein